jgi:DNA polymerase-2
MGHASEAGGGVGAGAWTWHGRRARPAPVAARSRVQACLLTRSYRDRGDRLQIELWGRAAQGPLRVRIDDQPTVCFVERGRPAPAAKRRELELRDLAGAPVDGLYFDTQRELQAARERTPWLLEADVKPHDRYLMERFVTGGFEVEGELQQRDGFVELHNPSLRGAQVDVPLKLLSFDIETDDLDGPVLSIAATVAGVERVFLHGEAPDEPVVQACGDEAAVIAAFVDFVRVQDPDLLVGWNVVEFDLLRLCTRARALGVELNLGRDRSRAEVLVPKDADQVHIARIAGRVVLDGIATLRSASFAAESFSLEDIAQQVLGRGKLIHGDEDRLAEIRRLYATDRGALARYNLEDCRLVAEIFEKLGLVGFVVERQRLTGLALDRQGGSVAALDNLYLPRLHRLGHVAPTIADLDDVDASPGGYVLESRPGLYRNVLVFDFKSLYPSIIRTFKVDPLGLAQPGDDAIEGFDGARFSRERHILPELIAGLWQARDEAKARRDATRSQAIKILMNSFYGVLGSPGCRFYSPKLASSITRRGHQIILTTRDLIETCGLGVLYGDTDSLFVWLDESLDEAQCRARGQELAAEINAMWRQKLRETYALDSHLEVQFERHFLRFFMPTMRGSERGSKKRYAGTVRAASGEVELVVRGLEAVRTDWTPLARRFQRELLLKVLTDQPHEDYIREITAQLGAGQLDAELVYTRRLRRELDDYEHNVPPHVQAARKLPRPPRRVRYVITTRGPEPVELLVSPIDHAHYLQRQIAPAADALLQCLGTSFARIAGDQLSLF